MIYSRYTVCLLQLLVDRSTDYLCNNNNDTDVEMYKEVVSTVVSTVYGVGEEEYCMNLGNVTVMYEHCAAYTTCNTITCIVQYIGL